MQLKLWNSFSLFRCCERSWAMHPWWYYQGVKTLFLICLFCFDSIFCLFVFFFFGFVLFFFWFLIWFSCWGIRTPTLLDWSRVDRSSLQKILYECNKTINYANIGDRGWPNSWNPTCCEINFKQTRQTILKYQNQILLWYIIRMPAKRKSLKTLHHK